jgi:hypothetical protein
MQPESFCAATVRYHPDLPTPWHGLHHHKRPPVELLWGQPFPGNPKLYALFFRKLDVRGVRFGESQHKARGSLVIYRPVRKALDPQEGCVDHVPAFVEKDCGDHRNRDETCAEDEEPTPPHNAEAHWPGAAASDGPIETN